MLENNKTQITVNIDENIKDKLETYKEYGYNPSEIIAMGIILLQDSKNFETLLQNKQKEEKIIKNIIQLNNSIQKLNKKINNMIFENEYQKLQAVIQKITEEEIEPREQIVHTKHGKPEPLNPTYIKELAQNTEIKEEIIKTELINQYTECYLKELNMEIK